MFRQFPSLFALNWGQRRTSERSNISGGCKLLPAVREEGEGEDGGGKRNGPSRQESGSVQSLVK